MSWGVEGRSRFVDKSAASLDDDESHDAPRFDLCESYGIEAARPEVWEGIEVDDDANIVVVDDVGDDDDDDDATIVVVDDVDDDDDEGKGDDDDGQLVVDVDDECDEESGILVICFSVWSWVILGKVEIWLEGECDSAFVDKDTGRMDGVGVLFPLRLA